MKFSFQRIALPALIVSIFALASCGAPVSVLPTSVPTTIPTLTAPTAAPTAIPPTPVPSATAAPTVNPDLAVRDAFAKFASAKSFRLVVNANVTPVFFDAPYNPAPGQDPNNVLLFSIQGEQSGTELHYALKGFMASLIGIFSGFDPDKNELEITRVKDALYMRGTLENETQARWYTIPAQDAASMTFAPQELMSPFAKTTYSGGAFSKTGSETLNGQLCNIFSATRASFDAVFPLISKAAVLNQDIVSAETVDRAEFQVSVCADGYAHRVKYNFDAHSKNDATKKGFFTFEAQLSDFDANIIIQAPADSIALPATSFFPTPSSSETPRAGETKTFASLEGEWEGTSADDSPISFQINNDAISFANLNYYVSSGGCSVSGAFGTSVENGAVLDKTFSVTITNSSGLQFVFQGTFDSNDSAAGTLTIKGKTSCGEVNNQVAWTAKHKNSPDSTPESDSTPFSIPTVEPTQSATTEPTSSSTSANIAIANAVFDALARRDIEGALAYAGDDIVYSIAGTSGVGKSGLRTYLQIAQFAGTTYQPGNLQDLGGLVTFSVTVSGFGAGTYSSSSAIIENGKVVVLTIK